MDYNHVVSLVWQASKFVHVDSLDVKEKNAYDFALWKSAKEGEILTSFEILADNVIRGEKYVFDVEKKYRGLFGRLRRDIKRRV